MAAKIRYGVTQFLKEANDVIKAAKGDAKALAALGYGPKDLAALVAAKKAVDAGRDGAAARAAGHRLDLAHVTSIREDGYRAIVHFRELVHIGLRGGDYGSPAEQQVIHSLVFQATPHDSDTSVQSQGTVLLQALRNKAIAASVKRRGWSAADTKHLEAAVAALNAKGKERFDASALSAEVARLANLVTYVRTVAHVAFKGNSAKLAPYKVSHAAMKTETSPN